MIIKLVLGKLKFVNDIFYKDLVHTHRSVTKCLGTELLYKMPLGGGAGSLQYMGYIGMCSRIADGF